MNGFYGYISLGFGINITKQKLLTLQNQPKGNALEDQRLC